MTDSNASERARSATHGFSLALRIRTLAALMWVVLAVASEPSAQAGINVWTKVGLPGGNVVTLAIDPTMPDTLYGGGERGAFKSTDGGITWAVNTGLTYPSGLGRTYPSVTALAIDPATPDSLFAGAVGGGVFKSTDGGNTWNATGTGWWVSPLVGVSALAIDPSTPGTLYAGFFTVIPPPCFLCEGATAAGGRGAALEDGVFKSTDGGDTWNAASTGLDFGHSVYALAIDPATPSILYAGTETGVFKSTDGGDTWNAVLPGYVAALAIDPISPATLYAGTRDGVFRSTDGGGTWSITGWTTPVDALAIDPGDAATLYAATASCGVDGCLNKVFKSADGGGTWSATGLTEPYERTGFEDTPWAWIKVVLAIDPTTPTTLYAGTISGVFKSTDGASAWRRTTSGTNDWVEALAIDPATPQALYAGTRDQWVDGDGAGVSKSTDGGATWGAASTGLPTGISGRGIPAFVINALAIDHATPGIAYAGTNDGVFKSTDGGGTWSATGLTELYVNALAIDPGAPATLYAATYEEGVFKSTDGGGRWAHVNTVADVPHFALAIDPTTPTTLYAGTGALYCVEFRCYKRDGVLKSTDGGGTWGAASTGLPPRSAITTLVIDPTTPTTLYAATQRICYGSDRGCYGREGLFKSTDGGSTWNAASTGLDIIWVSALAIDPTRPATLYAAGGNPTSGHSVFKSTDGGATWAAFDTGLYVYAEALAIDPTSPRTLYVGTRTGVFSIQQVGACLGDCDDSFAVGIDELVRLVTIVLGNAPASVCPHGVLDGAAVDITLLIQAVNNTLAGCRFTAQ